MKKLALRREPVTELTTNELQDVVAAGVPAGDSRETLALSCFNLTMCSACC